MSTISSFFGLNTALRGLLAQQQALDVTAHNIANGATEGYSRQSAVLSASQAMRVISTGPNTSAGYIGSGVEVEQFTRIRDQFADLQFRAQSQSLGQYETTSTLVGEAELNLSEPSDTGLNELLGKFWNAWDNLSNNPESPATRQALVNQAQLLTDRINNLQTQLSGVRAEAQSQYTLLTGANGDVAALANEIGQLNASIKAAVSSGGQPNDMLDRRDAAIDKLSKLAQVRVTDLGQGTIKIDFGDAATPLVNDTTVTWPQPLIAPGGQLGALLKLGDATSAGTITAYMNDMDGFAADLVSSVNALHPSFFSGTTASTITVAVTASSVKASALGPPAPAGANDIALAVSKLRGGLADNDYANLVARIGGDARTANQQQATAEALVSQASDRRQSVSGVSMDEEMSNMLKFQRGYQASARAMSTMDEMLDTLINRTGRVGL
jgi:flagellar hook-associated protein 1 FlgK